MGYIQKQWANPVDINATELNRIEKGIKDSHEISNILKEELSNIQLKQIENTNDIQLLLKDSPNVLKTLEELNALITNNSSTLEILKDTSNFATKQDLKKFLHITEILQDNKSIFSNGVVSIKSPTVDTSLNENSLNAISNKAVTQTIKSLTDNLKIPIYLKDLKDDTTHRLITDAERSLWNTIKDIKLEETDPTVPSWAKNPVKPTYSFYELTNRPTIYNKISLFPDASDYSLSTHNHNKDYAQIQHNHPYAQISHTHLQYANATHDHDSLYAPINHSHNFNIEDIKESLSEEISKALENNSSIIDSLSKVATSGKYSDLLDLPNLNVYTPLTLFNTHNHDNEYSKIGHTHQNYSELDHNHDSLYSLLNHNHDDKYSLLNHDHSDIYSFNTHTHTEFSLTSHTHDDTYSTLDHNHNNLYSSLNHNHDTQYSTISHNHNTLYSDINHTHDYSNDYAAKNHNHDTIYSKLNHTHTEFSSIVDATSVQSMINSSIDELINGADGTYDTLKELQTAIESNKSILDTLNNAIGNKANKSHTHTKSEITDFGSYLPTSGGTLTGSLTVSKGSDWGQIKAYSKSGYYRAFESSDSIVRIDVRDTTNTTDRRYLDIYSGSAKADNDNSILVVRNSTTDGTTATWIATQNWVNKNNTKLDGSNNYLQLYGETSSSNTTGWRLIATSSPTALTWINNHLTMTVASRHSGNGLLSIAVRTGSSINDFSASIHLYGATDTNVDKNAWKLIFNKTTGESKLYWRYNDWNYTNIKILGRSGFSLPSLGTWQTTTPTPGADEVEILTTIHDKDYLPLTGGTLTGELEATKFTENGTALSSKYLGINAKAASATTADTATKATQDGSGNVITSTYATKSELSNISIPEAQKINEISTQYIRITNLDTGIYRLTYNGTKYIYYNGSSSTSTHTVTGAAGQVILIVNKYSTTYWHWYYINGTTSYGTLYVGYTSTSSGSYAPISLNNLNNIAGSSSSIVYTNTSQTITASKTFTGSTIFQGVVTVPDVTIT